MQKSNGFPPQNLHSLPSIWKRGRNSKGRKRTRKTNRKRAFLTNILLYSNQTKSRKSTLTSKKSESFQHFSSENLGISSRKIQSLQGEKNRSFMTKRRNISQRQTQKSRAESKQTSGYFSIFSYFQGEFSQDSPVLEYFCFKNEISNQY